MPAGVSVGLTRTFLPGVALAPGTTSVSAQLVLKQMPQREAVTQMEEATDAQTMLKLHAAHLRRVNRRSAGIAAAVEHAAITDSAVARLWRQMNKNRTYAVSWASTLLLSKPGRRPDLTEADAKTAFWVAIDWGTYRTLTQHAGLTAAQFEQWLLDFYHRQFLDQPVD